MSPLFLPYQSIYLRWPGWGGELTWKYCKGILNRRDVNPALVVLFHPGRCFLPVGIFLALVGRADEEAAHVVLRRDDQQTVVGVAADATACLALAVRFVGRWETGKKNKQMSTLGSLEYLINIYRRILM